MSCNGCSLNSAGESFKNDVFNWLNDLPDTTSTTDIIEVKFKSTRKDFFRNSDKLPIKRGDRIVVAMHPGHDIGEVTLTGYLAEKQFFKRIKNPNTNDLNPVYRKATEQDLEKMELSRSREKPVLIRSRQIANKLGLQMKIADIEFRADNNKAIFYYIAEGRVDFRELIKIYASEFNVKIEMKQIGARQEAGLVGGIGSCGRELCCSSWRTSFKSISSDAALKQGLSPSAQKMAGACGKLKCCLMYELDMYIEASKDFPRELLDIETSKGLARPFKTDFLQKEIWYIYENTTASAAFKLSVADVKEIIQKNKKGIKPEIKNNEIIVPKEESLEVKLDGSIDRFDNKSIKRSNKFRPVKKNINQVSIHQKPGLN